MFLFVFSGWGWWGKWKESAFFCFFLVGFGRGKWKESVFSLFFLVGFGGGSGKKVFFFFFFFFVGLGGMFCV